MYQGNDTFTQTVSLSVTIIKIVVVEGLILSLQTSRLVVPLFPSPSSCEGNEGDILVDLNCVFLPVRSLTGQNRKQGLPPQHRRVGMGADDGMDSKGSLFIVCLLKLRESMYIASTLWCFQCRGTSVQSLNVYVCVCVSRWSPRNWLERVPGVHLQCSPATRPCPRSLPHL